MLFNSLEFILFFPLVCGLYFLLPHKGRLYLLVVASSVFYMAFVPKYILIIYTLIAIDYVAGLMIARYEGRARRAFLILSLIANIGFLGFFKYYNFLSENLATAAQLIGWTGPLHGLSILLPIGLSFHTFQSMSYTIEVYRRRQEPERSLLKFASYVLFFPQLVAGPIERPQNLLHQFVERHRFDYDRVCSGLKVMGWGMFKKVVIADRLAILANTAYADPSRFDGVSLTVATLAFAFQIYCDFSGYSDIAIGAAQVMGFRLMANFNRPYHAKSIAEFWQRWHISLSTWFRDYLYFPLGGSRVSIPRWAINIMIVFLISGLWHGANWTFVVWGALNGIYLIVGAGTRKWRDRLAEASGIARLPRLRDCLQTATVFALVAFGWIFFRASNLQDAWYIVTHLHHGWVGIGLTELRAKILQLSLSRNELIIAAFSVLALEAVHLAQRLGSLRGWIDRRPIVLRWGIYTAALWALLLLAPPRSGQFIYFQF